MSNRVPYPIFIKSPEAEVTVSLEWEDWLAEATIGESEWFVETEDGSPPTGIQITADDTSGTKTMAKITGGVSNKIYRLRNHVTDENGEEDDGYIDVVVMP